MMANNGGASLQPPDAERKRKTDGASAGEDTGLPGLRRCVPSLTLGGLAPSSWPGLRTPSACSSRSQRWHRINCCPLRSNPNPGSAAGV